MRDNRYKFIFEKQLDSKQTDIVFAPLPYVTQKGKVWVLNLQNRTLDLSVQQTSVNVKSSFQCNSRLMSNTIGELIKVCEKRTLQWPSVKSLLRMATLTVISVMGPTQVNFQCGNFGAKSVTLTKTYNVLLYHDSCFLTMRLPNSRQFELQATQYDMADPLRKIEVILVLEYNLSELSLFSDQVQVWVVSLLVLVLILIVLAVTSFAIFWHFRKTMTLRINNAIFDLEKSDQTHVAFKGSAADLQECAACASLVDPGPAIEELTNALKDLDIMETKLPMTSMPTTTPCLRRSSTTFDHNHIYASVSPTIRKPRMSPAVFTPSPSSGKPVGH